MQMKRAIKVVIADDHPVYRDGLRQMLVKDSDLHLICEASDGREALDQARKQQADVLLLDVDMPRMSGVDVARERQRAGDGFEIIFLTMHREADLLNEALNLDVKGYVLKDSAAAEIRDAVRTVAGGQHYLSPKLADFVVQRVAATRALESARPELASLTASERRILKLIASDRTSKEIATDLGLSVRTVENHRSNICNKLQLRGSHALLKFAFDNRSQL